MAGCDEFGARTNWTQTSGLALNLSVKRNDSGHKTSSLGLPRLGVCFFSTNTEIRSMKQQSLRRKNDNGTTFVNRRDGIGRVGQSPLNHFTFYLRLSWHHNFECNREFGDSLDRAKSLYLPDNNIFFFFTYSQIHRRTWAPLAQPSSAVINRHCSPRYANRSDRVRFLQPFSPRIASEVPARMFVSTNRKSTALNETSFSIQQCNAPANTQFHTCQRTAIEPETQSTALEQGMCSVSMWMLQFNQW